MQTITQSQIKSITKNIVQLSKESKPLQHSVVLEVFAKKLGYKDYNALIAKLKIQDKQSSPSKKKSSNSIELLDVVNELNNISQNIQTIQELFNKHKSTIPEFDEDILEDIIYKERLEYSRKAMQKVRLKEKQQSKNQLPKYPCPNCKGEGGWDIAVETDAYNAMWLDDGEFFELGYKKCFWCEGVGELSSLRLEEVKKIKKHQKI
ncbi:MAG: glyoxalase superfamily protein [Campylobacterota bacterium]|nr:glyoxalase superfamily protein [Campylobacterota bacterium]